MEKHSLRNQRGKHGAAPARRSGPGRNDAPEYPPAHGPGQRAKGTGPQFSTVTQPGPFIARMRAPGFSCSPRRISAGGTHRRDQKSAEAGGTGGARDPQQVDVPPSGEETRARLAPRGGRANAHGRRVSPRHRLGRPKEPRQPFWLPGALGAVSIHPHGAEASQSAIDADTGPSVMPATAARGRPGLTQRSRARGAAV